MLFQTISVETEVFKDVFHRDSKRQQIHGAADGRLDTSREGVQNLGDCCLHVANWLLSNKGLCCCACVCIDTVFLTHFSIISNGKGTRSREEIISTLVKCISLLIKITFYSHRQKMNWPHLNPSKSFVYPQNVIGFGVFSGIWDIFWDLEEYTSRQSG